MKTIVGWRKGYEFREVYPAGYLYAQNQEWYLLHPEPIAGAEWEEGKRTFRFYVSSVTTQKASDGAWVYPYARHVVVHGDFLIEYQSFKEPILIEIGLYDLSEEDWDEMEKPEFELEPNWNQLQMEELNHA